ncbi:MAG: hypothetical protein HQL37_08200 [Alphaproteobacteria bacterium]|nr:hypothetical protein [Alphaproteobacteria bacterium]
MASNSPICRSGAAIALNVLRDLLPDVARDGFVSLADVDRLIDRVCLGTVELDLALSAHQRICLATQAKQQGRIGFRSEPLQRVLVRPFEGVFFAEPPAFDRKFLPIYFEAAAQLIGPAFPDLDNECKDIIQAMLAIHGPRLSWEAFYAAPRTVDLMARAIAAMSVNLEGSEGAARWLTLMLKPASDGGIPTENQLMEVRDLLLSVHRGLKA